MSEWLGENPPVWWEFAWMVLALPALIMGEYYIGWDKWYGLPLQMFGVVGVVLMVARIRQLYRYIRSVLRTSDTKTRMRLYSFMSVAISIILFLVMAAFRVSGLDTSWYVPAATICFWVAAVIFAVLSRPGYVPDRLGLHDRED